MSSITSALASRAQVGYTLISYCRLDWLLKTEPNQELVRLLPECVRNDFKGLPAVGEDEELRRLCSIGRPMNLMRTVRIEGVHKANQEVGHVPAAEHVREFGGVRLANMSVECLL